MAGDGGADVRDGDADHRHPRHRLLLPAAVTAIGLADLYARFPLRIGLGLGGGAIALSSQDTGSGATANRDQAISQAILIGLLAGVPFAIFGILAGDRAISILGAPADVARMGGIYLAIVFLTVPARHVSLIGAVLAVFAPELVGLFTQDPEAAPLAATFARVYGVTASFLIVFVALSGSLQGASETRIPLVARLSGMLACQLGITYVLGVYLGLGAIGAYLGAGLTWVWMTVGVLLGFHYSDWATRAATMMADRGSIESEEDL